MTNPVPDKAYVFSEKYDKASHILLSWMGLTQFSLESDITRLWSSWEYGGNVYIPFPKVYNLTIPDIDGEYLFEGEIYTLQAEVENTEYAEFDFNDGLSDITFIYNSSLSGMSITSTKENKISFLKGDVTEKNNTHWLLRWNFILLPNIVD